MIVKVKLNTNYSFIEFALYRHNLIIIVNI